MEEKNHIDSMFHKEANSSLQASSLKVEVKNTTVGMLIEMLENDAIDLQPEFQRNSNLWPSRKQSELIESIALQLPLPSFYFYIDAKRKKWVVIDGLQRLCTFKNFFVDNTLKIHDLEILSQLNGQTSTDLDFFDRTNMKMFPVTLNVISGDVSAYAVSLIFKRVNSAGLQLKPAEIRNALFQGQATQLLAEMVKLPIFIKLVSNHISTRRMADRDYATRYLAFLLGSFEDYKGHMEQFLFDAMRFVNGLPETSIPSILEKFSASLEFCMRLFGVEAFRIPRQKDAKRKNSISLALFEILTVSFSRLSDKQETSILKHRDNFLKDYRHMFEDSTLKDAFTSSMGSSKKTKLRFEAIQTLIVKYSVP